MDHSDPSGPLRRYSREAYDALVARARELAPAVLYLGVGDGYGGSETALAAASTTPGVLAIATGEALSVHKPKHEVRI